MARASEDSDITVKDRLIADYEDFTSHHKCHVCASRTALWRQIVVPISISLATFMLMVILSSLIITPGKCAPGWNPSDFVGVTSELPAVAKPVRFTAGLLFNQEQELYRPIYPDSPQYVGPPTPEMDQAWEELIGSVNIFVTSDEEPTLGGGLYFQPESKLYMGQPTVTHDLHCLNMIRQNLQPYYDYYPHNNDSILRPHLEHCLDSIRQSIICTGDMTLSPIIWSYEKGRIIPNFEVDHTCRDYTALRDWTLRRDGADPARYPANAERLHQYGH